MRVAQVYFYSLGKIIERKTYNDIYGFNKPFLRASILLNSKYAHVI